MVREPVKDYVSMMHMGRNRESFKAAGIAMCHSFAMKKKTELLSMNAIKEY